MNLLKNAKHGMGKEMYTLGLEIEEGT